MNRMPFLLAGAALGVACFTWPVLISDSTIARHATLEAAPVPVDTEAKGVLKGKVTVDGTPTMTWTTEALQKAMKAKDEVNCLARASEEEKSQYEWIVDAKT